MKMKVDEGSEGNNGLSTSPAEQPVVIVELGKVSEETKGSPSMSAEGGVWPENGRMG